jgi:hypothetical protein
MPSSIVRKTTRSVVSTRATRTTGSPVIERGATAAVGYFCHTKVVVVVLVEVDDVLVDVDVDPTDEVGAIVVAGASVSRVSGATADSSFDEHPDARVRTSSTIDDDFIRAPT